MKKNRYIQLNRTFHSLPVNSEEESDFKSNYWITGTTDNLTWENLLTEFRVVILSEAGSGKTWELKHKAEVLVNSGHYAFFLRLENIADNFTIAFDIGNHEIFTEWIASENEGWFFFDSVDEARLKSPCDFELAIRKLGDELRHVLNRAHLYISSRASAWRQKTDYDFCSEKLPFPNEEKEEDSDIYKIVTLDNLTPDQIRTFTSARGISDNESFLNEVERAAAWSFTTRPQDLEELSDYWLKNNKIGTQYEIISNSIDNRLIERDQNRAETACITDDKIRDGVTLLAAAATLTANSDILIPDGANSFNGISIKSLFPDWNKKDLITLLSRPIFDEALYGTVRFHHRSVREFLAAQWFSVLLQKRTSRKAILDLFFCKKYGVDIIIPRLRSLLPWLILLDDEIRAKALKIDLNILLEGGDPSRLPIEIRRSSIQIICEQLAVDPIKMSIRGGYEEIRRFATYDLIDDVRDLLLQYSDKSEVKKLLLQMIWQGALSDLLPGVLLLAINPDERIDVRSLAIQAVKSFGSYENQKQIRERFLHEAPELNRKILSDHLHDEISTSESIIWLLSCLEKIPPEKEYSHDYLGYEVMDFIKKTDIELLPKLIEGFVKLLRTPPLSENYRKKISKKYKWLMNSATIATERIVNTKNLYSMNANILDIIHWLSGKDESIRYALKNTKTQFAELIPAWDQLNKSLFWFEVQKSRELVKQKDKRRITHYWQVSYLGVFWKFTSDDFDYLIQEIRNRDFLDDRLIALSLAFDQYKTEGRPQSWRKKLWQVAEVNDELNSELTKYFHPPPQSLEDKRMKQQESRWKKQDEERKNKEIQFHLDWKKHFNDNLNLLRKNLAIKPDSNFNSIWYLYEQAMKQKKSSNHWSDFNWKTLISDYGENIARFYRDATIAFWHFHKPTLYSEGFEFNQTANGTIIGLIGLDIESIEIENWTSKLSSSEVELACRYAVFELNGFPEWFPVLFEVYPHKVGDFILQEIQYELTSLTEGNSNYIIHKLGWSGQWAWDYIAPEILVLLKNEPSNYRILDELINMLLGSSVSNCVLSDYVKKKCFEVKELDHLALWFSVWFDVDPVNSFPELVKSIESIKDNNKQTQFAMIFITGLIGGRRNHNRSKRNQFHSPRYLKDLFLLMHQYIRKEDDIDRSHGGAYSPGLRDDAQDGRDHLFRLLDDIPGKESYFAMVDIANSHPREESRPWMLYHTIEKAKREAESPRWTTEQVKEFHNFMERTPEDHHELVQLLLYRLNDLKDEIENGDNSLFSTLIRIDQETEMRNFIGRELRQKSNGRYSVVQEDELADGKRPDLRILGNGFDTPVPVELKIADNWSGTKLFERLENQLCGSYLKDNRSNQGFYLLINRGDKRKSWKKPGDQQLLSFEGIIKELQLHWKNIEYKYPQIENIYVFGIDLTKRST